ncbi:hypothetical protein TKK_0012164 [Trichogramma kaykai]|uniref:WD repeat-containing protein 74 n=1 Tax=Trichogramma kaykai TaxID=54128 RepID=A0ABD2WNA0_9HYME
MSAKDFDVIVGGTTGFIHGVNISSTTNIVKTIQNPASNDNHGEVSCMEWENLNEQNILIGCGKNNVRSVKIYDTENHSLRTLFVADVGLGAIRGLAKYNEQVLTAAESGHIKLWNHCGDEEFVLEAGKNLNRMRRAFMQENIIATGGDENPLKLFDIERQTQIFTAKNVPNDQLTQLKVEIGINDVGFINNSEHIATAGKYGHIRLYDIKAQRRPVVNIQMNGDDIAIKALATCTHEDKHIIVGTGKGRMNLIDLRKPGKILNTYKGPAGAITAIAATNSEVVSISYDRYLYVHNIKTKALLKKCNLKSKLSAMVLRAQFFSEKLQIKKEVTVSDDDDDDDIFEDVELQKPKKRKCIEDIVCNGASINKKIKNNKKVIKKSPEPDSDDDSDELDTDDSFNGDSSEVSE